MADDTRVAMAPIAEAFGVAATVTRPYLAPISTTVIWLGDIEEEVPVGREYPRVGSRKLMALLRDDVPTLPRKTLIAAPEAKGGTIKEWEVEGTESVDTDEWKAIVISKAL